METDPIKRDLLITLDVLRVSESPVLIEDIVHFFINTDGSKKIENSVIVSKLKELESERKIFINEEGFVGLSENINEEISHRLKIEELTKIKIKYTQKKLKGLSQLNFIRYIGAFGEAPFGRIDEDGKINLIVIVEKDTKNIAGFLIKNYLKVMFIYSKFKIDTVLEVDNLRWSEANPESGIKLLNLSPILNIDKTYETLMASNNWIFEIFLNYPLEKISWGFRVSKNIGKKVPSIYLRLNKILSKT